MFQCQFNLSKIYINVLSLHHFKSKMIAESKLILQPLFCKQRIADGATLSHSFLIFVVEFGASIPNTLGEIKTIYIISKITSKRETNVHFFIVDRLFRQKLNLSANFSKFDYKNIHVRHLLFWEHLEIMYIVFWINLHTDGYSESAKTGISSPVGGGTPHHCCLVYRERHS